MGDMFRIFAVEPTAWAEWATDGLFTAAWGFHVGRTISRFPNTWVDEARTRIRALPDGYSKKVAEIGFLNVTKHLVDETDRDFTRSHSWLHNACREHSKRRFAGILCKDTSGEDCFDRTGLNDENKLWRTEPDGRARRSAEDIVKAAEPLIRHSRELKLIDPYFTQGEPNRLHRWKATCGEFLRIAFSGRAPKSQVEHPVEYHTLADGKVSGERFQARLEQDLKLQEFIPRGKRLVVVRWYPLKDGELFHARYVLTERGGLRYDAGLDENAKRQETDLSLVGRENLQKIRDNLKPSTGAYRYCDTTHVENGMVRTFQDDAMKPKAYK